MLHPINLTLFEMHIIVKINGKSSDYVVNVNKKVHIFLYKQRYLDKSVGKK